VDHGGLQGCTCIWKRSGHQHQFCHLWVRC
jgi:hypothetical protein